MKECVLDKMEKSFDDVSELKFEERPRTPVQRNKGSKRPSYQEVDPQITQTPIKKILEEPKIDKDRANLLNILKKIEKHKKEDNQISKNQPVDDSRVKQSEQDNKMRSNSRQVNRNTDRTDPSRVIKTYEINFFEDSSIKPINRLIIKDSSPKPDKKPEQKVAQINMQNHPHRIKDPNQEGNDLNRSESLSNISSSYFI